MRQRHYSTPGVFLPMDLDCCAARAPEDAAAPSGGPWRWAAAGPATLRGREEGSRRPLYTVRSWRWNSFSAGGHGGAAGRCRRVVCGGPGSPARSRGWGHARSAGRSAGSAVLCAPLYPLSPDHLLRPPLPDRGLGARQRLRDSAGGPGRPVSPAGGVGTRRRRGGGGGGLPGTRFSKHVLLGYSAEEGRQRWRGRQASQLVANGLAPTVGQRRRRQLQQRCAALPRPGLQPPPAAAAGRGRLRSRGSGRHVSNAAATWRGAADGALSGTEALAALLRRPPRAVGRPHEAVREPLPPELARGKTTKTA